MVRRANPNPFEEEEVNPFSDPAVWAHISRQSHYSAGPLYTTSTGGALATNSKLSPLAPESSDFTYDRDVTVDIPLGTTKVCQIMQFIIMRVINNMLIDCFSCDFNI